MSELSIEKLVRIYDKRGAFIEVAPDADVPDSTMLRMVSENGFEEARFSALSTDQLRALALVIGDILKDSPSEKVFEN